MITLEKFLYYHQILFIIVEVPTVVIRCRYWKAIILHESCMYSLIYTRTVQLQRLLCNFLKCIKFLLLKFQPGLLVNSLPTQVYFHLSFLLIEKIIKLGVLACINNFVYLELVIDMSVIQLFVKNQKHLICKLKNSLNQCLHRVVVPILEFFPLIHTTIINWKDTVVIEQTAHYGTILLGGLLRFQNKWFVPFRSLYYCLQLLKFKVMH